VTHDRDREHSAPCKRAILSAIVANDVCRTAAVALACLIDGLVGRECCRCRIYAPQLCGGRSCAAEDYFAISSDADYCRVEFGGAFVVAKDAYREKRAGAEIGECVALVSGGGKRGVEEIARVSRSDRISVRHSDYDWSSGDLAVGLRRCYRNGMPGAAGVDDERRW